MLREDPDVILVWEMRDLETIQATLTLAETWHLVFSTLHTVDSIQSIDRIVDVFPADKQQQIRMQLSMSLIWIISQRLLPHKTLDARIPAREVLINNDAIRNNIVKWKTNLLYWILETGSSTWMILMDKYLLQLFKKWLITHEILISYARDPDYVESILKQW
jgi:twitching motility protein PilT